MHMKPFFTCELQYFPSPHLSHLYDGFEKLRQAGVVSVSSTPMSGDYTKPLLRVRVNDKHRVIYDTLDGLNWTEGSTEDNLSYFTHKVEADYYFKRSFNQVVVDHAPARCKVFPLGLNIPFTPEGTYQKSLKERGMELLKDSSVVSRFYKTDFFRSGDFEAYPVPAAPNKVLFLARLWNPDDVSLAHLKVEREKINNNRIECIRACRDEFGEQFTGGLQDDSFSRSVAPDLLAPMSLTKRSNFLQAVKTHAICIATTGLHDSIGWKVGEYVAASRAIVSEPLRYELPGDFAVGKNYLQYTNKTELVSSVRTLLTDRVALSQMMRHNFDYYHTHVRPDVLVLNTLWKIYEDHE